MWYYDNMKHACARKGTTITQALKAIGRSTSATGSWSSGTYPRLDSLVALSDYLGITLDELVYGKSPDDADGPVLLSASEREWLSVISRIPVEKQKPCMDFLKTHVAEPIKYREKKNA